MRDEADAREMLLPELLYLGKRKDSLAGWDGAISHPMMPLPASPQLLSQQLCQGEGVECWGQNDMSLSPVNLSPPVLPVTSGEAVAHFSCWRPPRGASPAVCPSGITRGLCREERWMRWERAEGLLCSAHFSFGMDPNCSLPTVECVQSGIKWNKVGTELVQGAMDEEKSVVQ